MKKENATLHVRFLSFFSHIENQMTLVLAAIPSYLLLCFLALIDNAGEIKFHDHYMRAKGRSNEILATGKKKRKEILVFWSYSIMTVFRN